MSHDFLNKMFWKKQAVHNITEIVDIYGGMSGFVDVAILSPFK